jgi:AsmA protein
MTRKTKALTAVGGILAVVLALALFLRASVDPESLKPRIASAVKEITGMDLDMRGGFTFSVFPWIEIKMGETVLSNPEGYGGGNLCSVKRAEFRLKLLPLLKKEFEIGKVTLEGLELNLIKNNDGRLNVGAMPIKEVEIRKDDVVVTTDAGRQVAMSYRIAGVEISDSRFTYEDRGASTSYDIHGIHLKTGRISAGSPFDASLSLTANVPGENLSVATDLSGALMVDPFSQVFAFEKADLTTTVKTGKTPGQGATFKAGADIRLDLGQGVLAVSGLRFTGEGLEAAGDVSGKNLSGKPAFEAALAFTKCAPRTLAAALGLDLPAMADPAALSSVTGEIKFSGSAEAMNVSAPHIELDGTAAALQVSIKQKTPLEIGFSLKADTLDLDRYMPSAETAKGEKAAPESSGRATNAGKSPAMAVSGTLEIGALTVSKMHMQDVAAAFSFNGQKAAVNPFSFNLYGGSAKGILKADLSGKAPAVALTLSASGVQAKSLLTDLSGQARFSGTVSLSAALSASGDGADAMTRTLGGKVAFSAVNGAVEGVDIKALPTVSTDLVATAQSLASAFTSSSGKTNYERISASFALKNGLASNKDFKAVIPPHAATGAGTINLPGRTIDYTVKVDVDNLGEIPVRLTGALDAPNVSVDPAALAKSGLLKAAGGALGTLTKPLESGGDLGKGLLDAVGGIFGGKK